MERGEPVGIGARLNGPSKGQQGRSEVRASGADRRELRRMCLEEHRDGGAHCRRHGRHHGHGRRVVHKLVLALLSFRRMRQVERLHPTSRYVPIGDFDLRECEARWSCCALCAQDI